MKRGPYAWNIQLLSAAWNNELLSFVLLVWKQWISDFFCQETEIRTFLGEKKQKCV